MALSAAEQVRWWTVGLAVAFAFLWLMSGVLLPFLAGAALAYFLDPLADRLERRGLSRTAATAVVTLVMAGLFFGALVILIPTAITEAQALVLRLPQYANALRDYAEVHAPELLAPGGALTGAVETLRTRAEEWSVAAVKGAWTGGLAVVDFLTLMVITPVVAFYLLLDWDRLTARIDGWIPRDHLGTVRRLARDVDRVLAGFVRGQLLVCAILGLSYAVALTVVGLDFGLAIGLFAGLVSFIPFVGSILGGAISIGVALFQFWDDPVWILVVAGVFLAGQAIEGNFLTPKLVGGSVGLHPVALIFALSAFGSLLGFTGLLIAVPTAAAIGVVGRFAVEQYLSGRLYKGLEWHLERESRVELIAAETHPPTPPQAEAEAGPNRDAAGGPRG